MDASVDMTHQGLKQYTDIDSKKMKLLHHNKIYLYVFRP